MKAKECLEKTDYSSRSTVMMDDKPVSERVAKSAMILFARFHVKAALERASKVAGHGHQIKNCYPINEIE